MKICVSRLGLATLAGAALGGVALLAGADDSASFKGLELTAKGVERSARVSLQDCPPGENIVKGVIRPVEDNEFATIQIDVKVLPAFEGGEVPKPLLYDDAGKEYKTGRYTFTTARGAGKLLPSGLLGPVSVITKIGRASCRERV